MKVKLYQVRYQVNGSKRKHSEQYKRIFKFLKEFERPEDGYKYMNQFAKDTYHGFPHIGLPGGGTLTYLLGRNVYFLIPENEINKYIGDD